jgi:hypothetical protein
MARRKAVTFQGSRRRRKRKRKCKFGVNKNTGACLKNKRARRR